MKIIDTIICSSIAMVVGTKLLEETADQRYPNRPKGFFRGLFYSQSKPSTEKVK